MVEVLASEEHGVVGVSLGTTGTAMSSNQVGRTGGTGVLDAVLESAGSSTELTMDLAQSVCSTFQRLRRRANNRGDRMVSELYREFAENLNAYV